MKVKKEVDIVLIIVFIVLFFSLGTYIGVKDELGEKVINIDTESVWKAAEGAKDIIPQVTIFPEEAVPDESKQPFEEKPSEVGVVSDVYTIEIMETRFYPEELNIRVGNQVTWINKDSKHNYQIYERSEKQIFNSLQLRPGHEFSYTFNETGIYYFSDAIFKYMKGKIVVTD